MRASDVVRIIGKTPLVLLARLPPGPGRLLAKAEHHRLLWNQVAEAPGPVDDRPGRPVLDACAGVQVEMTSGNMGAGLAVVCAALGHPLTLVEAHEQGTGPEIWRQVGGRLDAFVAAVGSGGTFVGTSRALKARDPAVLCVAVEPAGAEVLAGKQMTRARHRIQGIGYGLVPPHWDVGLADRIIAVDDDEAVAMARRLGRCEGLCVGPSSGANVLAAQRLLCDGSLRDDAVVVTVLCDSGLKYGRDLAGNSDEQVGAGRLAPGSYHQSHSEESRRDPRLLCARAPPLRACAQASGWAGGELCLISFSRRKATIYERGEDDEAQIKRQEWPAIRRYL